jgi:hypothetical protein
MFNNYTNESSIKYVKVLHIKISLVVLFIKKTTSCKC